MATRKSSYKPLPKGAHVGGKYRSATWTGHIEGVIHKGSSAASTEYAIRPDKDSRHPGEPRLIHRHGDKIHRVK